jgi:pilus assembly protein Flp/PilA
MKLQPYLADETGSTNIEYTLVAAGIAAAIVLVVSNIGSTVGTYFFSVVQGLAG